MRTLARLARKSVKSRVIEMIRLILEVHQLKYLAVDLACMMREYYHTSRGENFSSSFRVITFIIATRVDQTELLFDNALDRWEYAQVCLCDDIYEYTEIGMIVTRGCIEVDESQGTQ